MICIEFANDIKTKVKQLGFSRYKYIVTVIVGDNNNQGLYVASRCFWDDKRDGFVSESFKLGNVFIVVNVFATYLN